MQRRQVRARIGADDGAGDQAAAAEQRQVERLDGEALDGQTHGAPLSALARKSAGTMAIRARTGEGKQAVDGVELVLLSGPAILMRDA